MRVADYLVFLRAINLGKWRRVPMADLVACLESAGCQDVATYLATGNVRLSTRARSRASVERTVEGACREQFGFEVPAIAYTPTELATVVAEAVALDVAAPYRYVTLLKEPVAKATAREIDEWSAPGEGARAGARAVHWWTEHGTQGSQLSNDRIERQLGRATTRTLTVVRTVAEKWS